MTADAAGFSRHKQFREKQKTLHEAWLRQKKEHDEKLARGEKVGKLGPDPTAEYEVGLVGFLKFLVFLLLLFLLAGKFFTGSYLWEYESKWTQLKTYWPVRRRGQASHSGRRRILADTCFIICFVQDKSAPVFRRHAGHIRRHPSREADISGCKANRVRFPGF